MRGLFVFGLEVNRLIDEGKTETLDTIYHEIENGNAVRYLVDKYKLAGWVADDSVPVLDEAISQFSFYDTGDYLRKLAVKNNGLNVIIALIMQILEDRK